MNEVKVGVKITGDFKEIFDKQLALQEKVGCKVLNIDMKERERLTKEFILAMHAELSELLEWTNWKMWKKTKVDYTPERLSEIRFELIDILHFWVNLCLIWGIRPETVMNIYREKNTVNHKRQDEGY